MSDAGRPIVFDANCNGRSTHFLVEWGLPPDACLLRPTSDDEIDGWIMEAIYITPQNEKIADNATDEGSGGVAAGEMGGIKGWGMGENLSGVKVQ